MEYDSAIKQKHLLQHGEIFRYSVNERISHKRLVLKILLARGIESNQKLQRQKIDESMPGARQRGVRLESCLMSVEFQICKMKSSGDLFL
jgi:predicted peroxiredoxin